MGFMKGDLFLFASRLIISFVLLKMLEPDHEVQNGAKPTKKIRRSSGVRRGSPGEVDLNWVCVFARKSFPE
jgi:hypothetical protein